MKDSQRHRQPDDATGLGLVPVTRENWQHCIHLAVAPDQAGWLASNLYSLAEAYVDPQCIPRAIYMGTQMVGFVLYEYNEVENAYNIPRFMIDRRFQGQGYGRLALGVLLDTLKDERPQASITISVTVDNPQARRLYERLGFEDTGQCCHGEQILRYP